ncbi:hypothetical protein DFJ73DRAFT_324324 [Zopfochytrium polystomum]|nr:hypothetical protein DFJ73DRAFT_324324 [Zopfochytrium polystomum]
MVDPVYSFSHTSEKFRTRLVREGVPQLWRGHVWYHLLTHQSGLCKSTADHDVLDSELISELSKLRSSESKHDKLIIRDVDEAFPNHVLFLDTPAPDGESSPTASKGKAGLKALLLAFSQGERKFGYWRGLSKIAAVLLLLMEEERAYVALAHMFHAPPTPQPPVGNAIPRPIYNLRSLIATGDASVDAEFLFIHEELMRLWTPKLFARWIQQNSVPSESYLFAWINSMFVEAVSPVDLRSAGAERVDEDRSFIPFRVLVRVWDLVMLWGVDLLFVVAVALLKKHEAFLLSLPPSSAAYFLLPPPPTMDDSSESSIASPPLIHTVRAVWTSNPSLPATTGSSSVIVVFGAGSRSQRP